MYFLRYLGETEVFSYCVKATPTYGMRYVLDKVWDAADAGLLPTSFLIFRVQVYIFSAFSSLFYNILLFDRRLILTYFASCVQ